jgi:hypothetical protein
MPPSRSPRSALATVLAAGNLAPVHDQERCLSSVRIVVFVQNFSTRSARFCTGSTKYGSEREFDRSCIFTRLS